MMKPAFTKSRLKLMAALAAVPFASSVVSAQIVINASGSYTQNFNTLLSTGSATWTDDSTIAGWYAQRTGTGTSITASTGSSTGGDLYSFGSTSASDRALGSLGSGNAAAGNFAWGVQFQNTTVGNVSLGELAYVGEQWRNSAAAAQTITLWYRISSSEITSLNPGANNTGWTALSSLDFTGPINGGSSGSLDGNAIANRTAVSGNLGLTLAAGEFIMFRWSDPDHGGTDHGLGIDDFSLNFTLQNVDLVSIGAGAGFSQSSFGGSAFNSGAIAVFNGVAKSVALDGAVVAAGLIFENTGYEVTSLTAGDTLSVTGAINVLADVEATISGKVTGGNVLNKTGAGTLNLTNAGNDFFGNVNVSAGLLTASSDGALGNSANDIVLGGGTFGSIGSFTLSSGRDITGAGGIAVAEGDTLTITGTVNTSALTLSDKGTLALNGSSNTLGALTFAEAGVLTGQVVTVSSLTTTHSTGTARIENGISVGAGDRAFSIAGDLELDGALSGAGRIVKTGAGTLTVGGGATSFTGGFRIGVQGATPSEGGRVVVSESGDLGGLQLQLNSGTLEATQELAFANGISIGGRNNNGVSAPTLDGANMSFEGQNSFFRSGGTTGQLAVKVNNTTTLNGNWLATSGGGSTTGITLGGTGSLVIAGDASAVTDTWTLADTVTFRLNNALGGGVNVASGTTLTGDGEALGLVTVQSGGVIAPGNSIGRFDASGGITFLSGATASFELGEDGVSSDQIATTAFSFNPETGTIIFDFNGTGVDGGAYTLMSFTSLEGGLTEGDSTPFSYINLKEGLFGSFTLTGTGLGFSVSVVPEPSAAAAIAGSLVLAGVALRRRRVRAEHGTC